MINKKKQTAILKKQMFKGISQLIVREFLMKIVGISGQIILVRIMLPSYFGVYAILSFIVYTAEILSDIGLSQAIIQKKTPITMVQLSSLFYVKLALSCFVCVSLFFLAPFIHILYKNFAGEQIHMLGILSLILIIKPFRMISIARLEKDLRYDAISIIDIVGIIAYYIVALGFAYEKFFIWNFIYALLLKEVFEVGMSLYFYPWFPAFKFNFREVKKMISFGSYLQFGNIMYYFRSSIIPVVGGIKFSSGIVGLLDWSSTFATLPNSVAENFGRVAFSGFSRIQDDMKLLSASMNKSLSIMNLITLFMISIAMGYGFDFVHLLLTDKWIPALHALYWYMMGTFFLGGTSVVGHGVMARGRVKEVAIAFSSVTLLELILVFTLIPLYSYTGIAVASCISSSILLFLYFIIAKRNGFLLTFKNTVFDKVVVFIITIICMFFLNSLLSISFLLLIIKVIITTFLYIFLSYIFSKKEIMELYTILKKHE